MEHHKKHEEHQKKDYREDRQNVQEEIKEEIHEVQSEVGQITDYIKQQNKNDSFWKFFSIGLLMLVAGMILGFGARSSMDGDKIGLSQNKDGQSGSQNEIENAVLPQEGIDLPIRWGDLGQKMIAAGVIDKVKFEQISSGPGGKLTQEQQKLLYGQTDEMVKMTLENSSFLLNLFWGFGLSNKSTVLSSGPMSQPGMAPRLASTGGWTISVGGDPMKHYNAHNFLVLTGEQSKKVEEITKNIYRPCCGNSTYFPDCNHGMAMLGLVELLVANGISDDQIYQIALKVNSYWFPDNYLTIAKWLESKNIKWSSVNPMEILGVNYSSGQGYQKIQAEAASLLQQNSGGGSGSGCSLGSGSASPLTRPTSGCNL